MSYELTGDQIRIQTNATQLFEAWREADREFRHSYRGNLSWRGPGRRYLYRSIGGAHKSLGVRSPETEKLQTDYTAQRTRIRERRARLWKALTTAAPINRAYRLGRVPKIAASILRELDGEGMLGSHLLVIGTHSIFAYEAAAGVHLADDLIATTDIDLLWDARRHLKLVALDKDWRGVLGVLRRVDPSFARGRNTVRASNDEGYMVDLVRPFEPTEILKGLDSSAPDDLDAVAILGLQWLINAPRFSHLAMGDDGYPVRIACVDPRVFALHKLWMATEAPGREPAKARRDRAQAIAIADLARNRLGLAFNARELSALPLRLVQHAKTLA